MVRLIAGRDMPCHPEYEAVPIPPPLNRPSIPSPPLLPQPRASVFVSLVPFDWERYGGGQRATIERETSSGEADGGRWCVCVLKGESREVSRVGEEDETKGKKSEGRIGQDGVELAVLVHRSLVRWCCREGVAIKRHSRPCYEVLTPALRLAVLRAPYYPRSVVIGCRHVSLSCFGRPRPNRNGFMTPSSDESVDGGDQAAITE